MSTWDAIFLGIVQGLTEFLPISSSGHLVLTQRLLGLDEPGTSLEIWLHVGTLVAVLVYFRVKIIMLLLSLLPSRNGAGGGRLLLLAVIAGTIPAVIVGFSLKGFIESTFDSPHFASIMLMVTGLILLSTIRVKNKSLAVNLPRSLLIGLAQAAAILPGISRSGSTIAAGMHLGVAPAEAAEFSFLLAIPAIGGAFLLDLLDNSAALFAGGHLHIYIIGMAVSFAVGLVSIHYLLKIVRRGKFFVFGFYCLVAGVISLILVV